MEFSKSSKSKKSDPSKAAQTKEKEALEDDYTYAPVLNIPAPSSGQSHQLDRTMFIVDLSRLKAERDTLENALIMYRPEREFKKPQYEQRCSQLVGLSLCTLNLTGKYPEFLRLRGTGYAIRGLGEHYLMGLSSRMEEPSSYCVNYLKLIHSCFLFYYHSPAAVLKSVNEVWEDFAKIMTEIFKRIIHYILRDQHSVPAMLNPIPYINTGPNKRNFARTYLLASRILKTCQQHSSIAGGCIFFNERVVIGQFPPDITEKLLMIGGGAISLSKKNILGDNIAPGKVWVLEVYLTPEDHSLVTDCCKDHTKLKQAYSSMDRTRHLTMSTIDRLQSSTDAPNRPENIWRGRTNSRHEFSSTETLVPGSASTPTQNPPPINRDKKPKSLTARSEDAVVISPGLSSVFYDANDGTKNRNSSSSSTRQDGDEYEYVDAVETMDPGTSSTPGKPIPKPHSENVYDDASSLRPASVSSEVFQTPSPSPPREEGSKKPSQGSNAATGGKKPEDLSEEELAKLINAPMKLESIDSTANLTKVSKGPLNPIDSNKELAGVKSSEGDVGSGALDKTLSPRRESSAVDPPELLSQQVSRRSFIDDDSDDFVDSSLLEEMVEKALRDKRENSISTGPPLPPRNQSKSSRPLPKEETPPPLPPRNQSFDKGRRPTATKEDNSSTPKVPVPVVRKRASIYDTLDRGATLERVIETKNATTEDFSSELHRSDDGETTPIPTHDIGDPGLETVADDPGVPSGIYSDDIDSIPPKQPSTFESDIAASTASQAIDIETPSLIQSVVDYQSSFEDIPEVPPGMRTPPIAPSFGPESLMQGLPLRLDRLRKLRAPTLPPRKQKIRPKKVSRGSGSENTDSEHSSDSDEDIAIEGRPFLLPTTIKRPQSASSDTSQILKRCLYVQQYMGTEVVLLGSDDLHTNHTVLNSLWRSLLLSLHELDSSLKKDCVVDQERNEPKPAATAVTYSSVDRRCEANPVTTAYHFRHAMRRIHQEYGRDPSLLQCSVSKEHLRMISQSVHRREVYIQPSRLGHLDVLAMHAAVEKYAKTKTSLRQQPSGGPKIMIL